MGITTAFFPLAAFADVHPGALGYEVNGKSRSRDAAAELHCLALNIYHEARSEPDQGKFAVAQVTLNRVKSPRYPNSICAVVWQRKQFSWTRDGRSDRPYNLKAWKDALWVATVAYEFNPLSVVGQATHYHAVYVHPFWAASHRCVAKIGKHIFYEPSKRS